MGRHPRLSWLAACALLFACGGDPAPKQVEQPRSGFKSKKKKKHKSEDAEASTDSEKPRSKEDKERELEREAEQEKQERKERQRKREQEAEEQEKRVAATDDGGSSDAESDAGEKSDEDGDAKKAAEEKKAEQEEAKAKKKAAREEALARKKAAREEALAKKKAAAEEAKAKKLAAAEAKKSKKKKGKEDAEEASSDASAASEGEATKSDEETSAAAAEEKAADEETPKAKRKGAKDSKAKKKVAKADDEEAEAEAAKAKTKDDDEESSTAKAKVRKGKAKAKDKDKGEGEQEPPKETEKTDEDSIDMEETTTASIKDPSHDSDELDLTSTPKETKEEDTAPPVPLEIDRRPLTAAKGRLEVHGGLRVGVLTTPNGMGGKVSSTSEGLALGATYGLGGKAEVGFDYTVGLNPGSAKGPLLLHGAYRVAQSEKLDMALAAGFGVDFISVTDPATMMTTSQTATALELGGWVRYHVGPTLSVFTGLPALPSSSGNLSSVAALPPLPYQLTIGLSSKGAIGLDVPVGAGFQATPKIYAFATVDLAHIGMSNTDSAFVFADFIPLALGGFYAANKIDIGAVLGDDLKQGADYLRFDIVARYSLK
ncbi:MAG TPA: hypothetical protein VLB44_16110 [Kofleriaceae bacterium]|nr:hypothetical protein [Kofleriaceae bacterium]